MALIKCSECNSKISDKAANCVNCGNPINNVSEIKVVNKNEKGIAAILSYFVPGLGQMYRGKIASGFLWLLITLLGYACFIVPGIILHLICIGNAASNY